MTDAPPPRPPGPAYASPAGRRVLAAVVLGSGMAFLDTTVVNVALPVLRDSLDASFSDLQWVLDGYLLTLGALLLLGGSLGDRYGRRRLYLAGLSLFTAASLGAGIAPGIGTLVAARVVQGVGAAMLVPGSLAILGAVFSRGDRERAIGTWAAMSGVSTAIGPFVGGWLVDTLSWRTAFLINVPLALVTAWLTRRHVPETRAPDPPARLDVRGALLGTLGLGAVTAGLVEGPVRGWGDVVVVTGLAAGGLLLVAFVAAERRTADPMLPLDLFRVPRFAGANLATAAVYGALSVVSFLLVLHLQQTLGYSALGAGVALLPVNLLLVVGSPVAGRVAATRGHRLPMVVGPLVGAAGLLLAARIVPGTGYLTTVFPAAVVFGLGLATTVAPITSAALDAVDEARVGVASGVNNAVARIAGLVGIAVVPAVAGVAGSSIDAGGLTPGFRRSMLLSAAVLVAGGLVAAVTVGPRDTRPNDPRD